MKNDHLLVSTNHTIIDCMNLMEELNERLLIVTDDNQLFVGLISIGDIQRAIISGCSLSDNICDIYCLDLLFFYS